MILTGSAQLDILGLHCAQLKLNKYTCMTINLTGLIIFVVRIFFMLTVEI